MDNEYYPVVIVGGGLCGLSAAYHLRMHSFSDYLVLEKSDKVGGYVSTQVEDGFFFDSSPHLLFSKDPYVLDLVCNHLLKDQILKFSREAYCFDENRYVKFPYQAHNYGLPTSRVIKNISGLVAAQVKKLSGKKPKNYEQWLYQTFGSGIANHYLIPYSEKLWSWDLKDMGCQWARRHVPLPNLLHVVWGALFKQDKNFGMTKDFWYPKQGGIRSLTEAFLKALPRENIQLRSEVAGIDAKAHQIALRNGRRIRYGKLLATMPLPHLVNQLTDETPGEIKSAALGLKHNYVHIVNIGVDGFLNGLGRFSHWLYFSQKNIIFHRVSFPHNLSPLMAPAGASSIQVEISGSTLRPQKQDTLLQDTLDGLVRAHILDGRDILPISQGGRVRFASTHVLDPAYVVYDHHHEKNTSLLINFLSQLDITTMGRFGKWEYFDMGRTILDGREAAEAALGLSSRE